MIGWIVGELKARTGAHEVILTIMLNYVMYNLLTYLLSSQSAMQQPGQTNQVAPAIAADARCCRMSAGHRRRSNVGFLIALAAAAASGGCCPAARSGFQFRTVGANPSAARSAGHERGADLGAASC